MKKITSLLLTGLFLIVGTIHSNAQQCGPSDDIVQNSTNGETGSGALQGQTFEATCTGPIEDITIFVANASNNVNAILELYQGTFGLNSTPIATATEIITTSSNTERFDFPTPVDLVDGQTYSFLITNTAGIVSYQSSNNNPYLDGVRRVVIGNQVFSFSATDLRFIVGYEDNEPPNAVCMDATLQLGADGTVVVLPSDVDGGSNGGIVVRSVNPDTFDSSNLGENTVTLNVGDAAGNFANCEAIVTIEPFTPVAEITLTAGDIAFMGSNSDPGSTTADNVSFVLLKDIDAASQIIFTDRGWSDTTGFGSATGDGDLIWTSGVDRTIGDIITLDLSPGNLSNNADFTTTGDQLFAIQGSVENPTFIAGLHYNVHISSNTLITTDENWDGTNNSSSTPGLDDSLSALPDALTNGDTAVRLTANSSVFERDNFRFSCTLAGGSPITGTLAQIRAVLHNRENWSDSDSTGFNPPVENGCSIAIGIDTEVSLVAGKLIITDVNGGVSNDNITLSSDGTTLTISNLLGASVSGGPILVGPTTVTIPLAAITNGIEFNAANGNNAITFANALTLIGVNNNITLNNISSYSQPGAITIEGAFSINGNSNATIVLNSITAESLSIIGVNRIQDAGSAVLNIAGTTTLQTNGNINLNGGIINNYQFGGLIHIEASNFILFAGGDITLGTITSTAPASSVLSAIRVSTGTITFTDQVQMAGESRLTLRGGVIQQTTSGTIVTSLLMLEGNPDGNSTAVLDVANNDISFLQVNNAGRPVSSLAFNETNTVELLGITVDEFTVTANTILFSENTVLTKNGTGTSTFNGNIDVNNTSNSDIAVINHNAGTINFQGTTNNFDGLFDYIGVQGTITNFSGATTLETQGVSLSFGYLNATDTFSLGNTAVNILDEARFSGASTVLKGRGTLIGSPVIIENNATITPGTIGDIASMAVSDLLISSAIYAPVIENDDDYDIVEIVGALTLTDATLSPVGGFVAQPDDIEIILIENDGTDAVIGTFNGLSEGSNIEFGDYSGFITYVGGNGNDVALLPIPNIETDVDLSAGTLTINDIGGGFSNDHITLSNDGTTLTISGLTSPVQVNGGPILETDTSVSIPIASITNGFQFLGEFGDNSLTIDDALTLSGSTNFFVASGLDDFIQNGALTIGDDISLEGSINSTNVITLGEITTTNLNIFGGFNIDDSEGKLNISENCTITVLGNINIDNGLQNESDHFFGGIVKIEADIISNFTAGSDINVGRVITYGANSTNNITTSGTITLSGYFDTASNADLHLTAASSIDQLVGATLITDELTITATTTAIFLSVTNDINRISTTNSLNTISFINSNFLNLGTITTNEFTFTAPEIGIDTETLLTKTGSGVGSFIGNLVSDSIEIGTINHNGGTIIFDGGHAGLTGIIYNGQSGTTTRFIGESARTDGDNFTFGTLESETNFDTFFEEITILDTSNFTGDNGQLVGNGTLNGPVTITNGGRISPGNSNTGIGALTTGNLDISSGIFEANIDGATTDLHDQIIVNGTVSLSNAILQTIGGFTPQLGDEIILIANDGTDAVNNTFLDRPEGSAVIIGFFAGNITYMGGDGNDVSIIADFTDPTAICQDITLAVGVDGLTVTGDQLDGGSTDNVEISEFLINGEASIDFTLDDIGDHEVTITVIDPNGNTATCTATITLVSNVNVTLPILISEYQPLPIESNATQTIEIKGASGESFIGAFVIIDGSGSRSDRGLVVDAIDVTGTFNAQGILTASVPDFTNPSHTAVLTSAFNGNVDVTDIDTDNDGTADDFTAFGDIFDAIGVQDGSVCCPVNVVYGSDFGGIDLPNIDDSPAAIFRDASEGDFYQINSSGVVYDNNGAIINTSIFDSTPTVDGTFGTINPSPIIVLRPTVYLQGAFTNPNMGEESLMRDDLRVAGLVPIVSPYGDGFTVDVTVFNTTGSTAVVDWVQVQLRDATDSNLVIESQSALLLRNGNIVTIDGISDLTFAQSMGNYHVAILHRNHLGVLTANSVSLSSSVTNLDLSSNMNAANGGPLALRDMGNGVFAIYAGDVTSDGNILNTDISNAISNSGGINIYSGADANMDGNILNTDIALIIQPNAGRIQQF